MSEGPIFQRVALIGLGLIAGSMSLAMREGGLAARVVGYARSAETRDTAREIGLVDEVVDSAAEAVAGADLVQPAHAEWCWGVSSSSERVWKMR